MQKIIRKVNTPMRTRLCCMQDKEKEDKTNKQGNKTGDCAVTTGILVKSNRARLVCGKKRKSLSVAARLKLPYTIISIILTYSVNTLHYADK